MQLRRITREARQRLVPLARFGFAAQGIVYILIGSLAALAALHSGGRGPGASAGRSSEFCLSPMDESCSA